MSKRQQVTEIDRTTVNAFLLSKFKTDLVKPTQVSVMPSEDVEKEFGVREYRNKEHQRLRLIRVECGEGTFCIAHANGVIDWDSELGNDDDEDPAYLGVDVGMHEDEPMSEPCDEGHDLVTNLRDLDSVGCATKPHLGHPD